MAVAAARRFTASALGGCPRAGDLVQALSELAANAVLWSAAGQRGTFTVRVRTAPRWARVEVTDPGRRRGRATGPGNGRGLPLVAALTDRCGATFARDGSRTAWAEVTWPAT